MTRPVWAAMQVTAEGGRDAAQEAPFIYAAIDQLANRYCEFCGECLVVNYMA